MRKKGFTLIELLVVIAIIATLMAILMPALGKVRRMAQQLVCGTNLKGLGTALFTYAGDYEDSFVIFGNSATWDSDWMDGIFNPDFNYMQPGLGATVSASLFLLVKEADVPTKSFVCGSSDQKAYEGENPDPDRNLLDMPDFGNHPYNHVSYAYQLPYKLKGDATSVARPADASSAPGMAIMADKTPWLDQKLSMNSMDTSPADEESWMSLVSRIDMYWDTTVVVEKWQISIGNSATHMRAGQNVLFADGHTKFEKNPDCGEQNDNIYSVYSRPDGPWNEDDRRQGWCEEESGEDATLYPRDDNDSFLVNDDYRTLLHEPSKTE